MTPERFADLADAHGANLDRWPAADRESARALIERNDPQALSALKEAAWLDQRLDRHRPPVPDAGLERHVLASAVSARRPSAWRRYGDWWSRLGFVGVGLAGVATGMLVASLSLPLSGAPDLLPSVLDHGDAEWILNLDAEEAEQ